METEDWVFGLGEDIDRDEFNAEQVTPKAQHLQLRGRTLFPQAAVKNHPKFMLTAVRQDIKLRHG